MPNIDIKLRVSKIYVTLLIVIVLVSLLINFTLPYVLWLKMIISCVIAVYGLSIIVFHGLLIHKHSIRQLWIKDTQWIITDKQKSYIATLSGTSTITCFVSILRFQIPYERKKRSCVIFRDSMNGISDQNTLLFAASLIG